MRTKSPLLNDSNKTPKQSDRRPILERSIPMKHIFFLLCFLCITAISAMAQDAVKVDPKHYTVEFENDQVRVLRIRYGPHE